MTISRDDFATWRANPVTEWVFAALDAMAEGQKQHWVDTSWDQGACAPELLLELRVRADTAKAINETSYERYCEVLGEEPQG
jgi:hypothetical protein